MRTGYVAIVGLLVVAAVEAYRIQGAISERHVEIYREYVKHEETLSSLRRNIWLSATFVREFFINPQPDRADLLERQLRRLEDQNRKALDELDRMSPPLRPHVQLRAGLREYWETLESIAHTKARLNDRQAYQFLQREIVPRRNLAGTALRQVAGAYQEALQNSEVEFAQSRRSAARRLVLVLGLCVMVGLLVARFSLRHAENLERQTLRHYEEVMQTKKDLEKLSARLLEIQEEERRMLSRGLHDEVGQTLTALRIEISHALALATAPGALERLERARGLAERLVQTVRDISLLLRPALLDDLGLAPAMQWQVEEFASRSGIACEFSEEGVQDLLPDAVKTCVFRVMQEALHNCEKHAAASSLRVVVRQSRELLTLVIEDNGRGFELSAKGMPRGAGLGVLGMRERAAMVGGVLAVESAPARGTRLSLRIPLADAAGRGAALAAGEGVKA